MRDRGEPRGRAGLRTPLPAAPARPGPARPAAAAYRPLRQTGRFRGTGCSETPLAPGCAPRRSPTGAGNRAPAFRPPARPPCGTAQRPSPVLLVPPWFLRPRPPAAWRGFGAAAAGVCPGFPGSAAHRRLAPTPARGAPAEPADKERQLAQPSTRHHPPGPGARAGTRLPSWDPVVRLSPPPHSHRPGTCFSSRDPVIAAASAGPRPGRGPWVQMPVSGSFSPGSWQWVGAAGVPGGRSAACGGDPAWKGRVGAEVEGAGPTGTG